MRVLFLDIDGVLNNHKRFKNGYCGIQKRPVKNLNFILNKVKDLSLVISSAWRYQILCGDMTIKGFENMLLSNGVDCYNKIVGYTVSDEDIPNRESQIYDWVDTHEVKSFIVVDDLDLRMKELVKTNPTEGLTKDNAIKIVGRFNYEGI